MKLHPLQVNNFLGMKNALPSQVQTFVTVDFFNHATKHTDLSSGYEPDVSTMFSFKNQVDNFFLSYLQKEYILIEVHLVKGSLAAGGGSQKHIKKIGEARLPLTKLLEKDTSF